MIEVEKNFDLRPGDKERLIAGAVLVKRRTFTDVYYDTPNLDWCCKDYWLRRRDGTWELKVPVNKSSINDRATDQYRELESELEITQELGFASESNLEKVLAQSGIFSFATIMTVRERYQKKGFTLDFDEMDFGFVTFEVEIMVEMAAGVHEAEKRIIAFARENGIAETVGHGKVIEYLLRFKPSLYRKLVESGVVAE